MAKINKDVTDKNKKAYIFVTWFEDMITNSFYPCSFERSCIRGYSFFLIYPYKNFDMSFIILIFVL